MMAVDGESEIPTIDTIADALGVKPDTIRDCLERDLELTIAHIIAFADLQPEEIDETFEKEFREWFEKHAWNEYVSRRSRSGYLIDTGNDCERLRLLRCPICGDDWLATWTSAVNDPLGRHLEEEHDADDLITQEND